MGSTGKNLFLARGSTCDGYQRRSVIMDNVAAALKAALSGRLRIWRRSLRAGCRDATVRAGGRVPVPNRSNKSTNWTSSMVGSEQHVPMCAHRHLGSRTQFRQPGRSAQCQPEAEQLAAGRLGVLPALITVISCDSPTAR